MSEVILTVDQFVAEMNHIADHFEKMMFGTVLGNKVRPILLADVDSNFDHDSTPEGFWWPPHAMSTVMRMGEHNLLEVTGALRAAATGKGVGAINEVSDRSLTIGVDANGGPESLKWAWIHQIGGKRIPAREYMGASEDALALCDELIADAGLDQLWFPAGMM